jgi:hypothetical protein
MSTSTNTDLEVQAGPDAWTPPSTVTGHQGDKLDRESDFFVRPPREIGAVKSAYTSLKMGAGGKPPLARIRTAAAWFGAGYVLAVCLDLFFNFFTRVADATHTFPWLWYGVLGALASFYGWYKTRLEGICNFVGAEGCAQFACRGKRENLTGKSIFLFQDAWALHRWTGGHGGSGRESYTSYYFDWHEHPPDIKKLVYSLVGKRSGNMQRDYSYRFALAVEAAWYDYLSPKVDAEIAQKGCLCFYESGLFKRWVRLGREFVEIEYEEEEDKGRNERLEAKEFRSVTTSQRALTIAYEFNNPYAKELGETTKPYEFHYGNIYNGRHFLYAFEKLLGINVQGRAARPGSPDAEQAEVD